MKTIDVDGAIIDRALSGDAKAIIEIVRSLQIPFYNLARRMIFDSGDAEDATQEALFRVVTHLSQFDARSRFSTWAWRIAVNQCIDFRAKRYRLPLLTIDDFGRDLAAGLEIEALERADTAALLGELKMGCGFAMLAILDADHRAAYVLGEILGLSGDESADILDVGAATFRKRLSRARERVTEALQAHCGIVNPVSPCRCHRRLRRAQELGRVSKVAPERVELDVRQLREYVASVDSIQKVTAYYRADPSLQSKKDYADSIRKLLQLGGATAGLATDPQSG